jgi:hypothetical protein
MMNVESHAGHSFEIVDNCIEDGTCQLEI